MRVLCAVLVSTLCYRTYAMFNYLSMTPITLHKCTPNNVIWKWNDTWWRIVCISTLSVDKTDVYSFINMYCKMPSWASELPCNFLRRWSEVTVLRNCKFHVLIRRHLVVGTNFGMVMVYSICVRRIWIRCCIYYRSQSIALYCHHLGTKVKSKQDWCDMAGEPSGCTL
jgi:hypothetical protein